MYIGVATAIRRFYRPFYETRTGQILLLAAAQDNARDALAAMEILRYFPYPLHANIKPEPSRQNIRPEKNVMVIGRYLAFKGQDPGNGYKKQPVSIGHSSFVERVESLMLGCCFEFRGKPSSRVLVNPLAGEEYHYAARDEHGHEIDYGVIRLAFRGVAGNTIMFEGNHQLGTLGLAKVGTTAHQLQAIWDAVTEIDDYNESLPLEIVVRTDFDPRLTHGVYTMEAIEVTPLSVVYNRKWAWNLAEGGPWVDQEPWDLILQDWGGDGASVPAGSRLEMEADLRSLDSKTRDLCRRLIGGGVNGVHEEAKSRLLKTLTRMSDRFSMVFYEKKYGRSVWPLPDGNSDIRLMRKQFLVHIILSHFMGRQLHCTDEEINAYFPGFRKWVHEGESPAGKFIQMVKGRMSEGFQPLLGKRGKPPQGSYGDPVRPE